MQIIDWILFRAAAHRLKQRRADFYYDMASALEDKVPLFTILRKYEARGRNRSRGDALLYRHMLREAMGGSLSQSLIGVVPTTELILIDAIQGSGDAGLARGLYFLSETVEKVDRMIATVRKVITKAISKDKRRRMTDPARDDERRAGSPVPMDPDRRCA